MGISLLMFTQYWGGVKFRISSVYCSKGGNIKVASILALKLGILWTQFFWISSNILWCSLQQKFMRNKIVNRKNQTKTNIEFGLLPSVWKTSNIYCDVFNLVLKKKSKTVKLSFVLILTGNSSTVRLRNEE